jgi:SAM-dependent methyltransferase
LDAIAADPWLDTEPDAKEMNDLLLRVMRGVNGQAFRLFGSKVHTGPFAGMIIPERTPHWDDGNSGTKLFGTYEHELHAAIEYAVWRLPKIVVNVGCAEGYYAIGLARMLEADVYGFDICEESLLMCKDYAERNNVMVTLAVGCKSPGEMRLPDLPGRRLYIVDVEGEEFELLDLGKCPELINSDIIVECHDFLRPQVSIMLADRFSRTHRIELVRPKLPDLTQFQFLSKFPTVMGTLMVVEKRPMPCCWLTAWANR